MNLCMKNFFLKMYLPQPLSPSLLKPGMVGSLYKLNTKPWLYDNASPQQSQAHHFTAMAYISLCSVFTD